MYDGASLEGIGDLEKMVASVRPEAIRAKIRTAPAAAETPSGRGFLEVMEDWGAAKREGKVNKSLRNEVEDWDEKLRPIYWEADIIVRYVQAQSVEDLQKLLEDGIDPMVDNLFGSVPTVRSVDTEAGARYLLGRGIARLVVTKMEDTMPIEVVNSDDWKIMRDELGVKYVLFSEPEHVYFSTSVEDRNEVDAPAELVVGRVSTEPDPEPLPDPPDWNDGWVPPLSPWSPVDNRIADAVPVIPTPPFIPAASRGNSEPTLGSKTSLLMRTDWNAIRVWVGDRVKEGRLVVGRMNKEVAIEVTIAANWVKGKWGKRNEYAESLRSTVSSQMAETQKDIAEVVEQVKIPQGLEVKERTATEMAEDTIDRTSRTGVGRLLRRVNYDAAARKSIKESWDEGIMAYKGKSWREIEQERTGLVDKVTGKIANKEQYEELGRQQEALDEMAQGRGLKSRMGQRIAKVMETEEGFVRPDQNDKSVAMKALGWLFGIGKENMSDNEKQLKKLGEDAGKLWKEELGSIDRRYRKKVANVFDGYYESMVSKAGIKAWIEGVKQQEWIKAYKGPSWRELEIQMDGLVGAEGIPSDEEEYKRLREQLEHMQQIADELGLDKDIEDKLTSIDGEKALKGFASVGVKKLWKDILKSRSPEDRQQIRRVFDGYYETLAAHEYLDVRDENDKMRRGN